MAEYIKREAALKICETEYQNRLRMLDYCGDTVAWNIGSEIKAMPAADVEPVRHGEWRPIRRMAASGEFECSVCGRIETFSYFNKSENSPYCHCGAKMDGGAENG